jgi:hypothetical protein
MKQKRKSHLRSPFQPKPGTEFPKGGTERLAFSWGKEKSLGILSVFERKGQCRAKEESVERHHNDGPFVP